MVSNQPSLLKSSSNKPVSSGPVFDFGPGWGTRLNKWFTVSLSNWFKKNSGKKILPTISIIILFLGLFLFLRNNNTSEMASSLKANIISQTVVAGDSKTHLARRAVTEYLKTNKDLIMTPGQRIFLESKLVQSINNSDFRPGQTIGFSSEQIRALSNEAESLSPATLQKWEGYARKVRF